MEFGDKIVLVIPNAATFAALRMAKVLVENPLAGDEELILIRQHMNITGDRSLETVRAMDTAGKIIRQKRINR